MPFEGADGFASVTLEPKDMNNPDAVSAAAESLRQGKETIRTVHRNRSLGLIYLGEYTAANGLFTPAQDPQPLLTIMGWYKGSKLIALEQLTCMVEIDDKTSFTIQPDELPATGMLPGVNLDADAWEHVEMSASDGSVAYRADSSVAVGSTAIETGVLIPSAIAADAASCELRTSLLATPTAIGIEELSGKPGIRVSCPVPADNTAESFSYLLTFKDANGDFLYAYNISISIRCGEPVPFPLYKSDWNTIPESRIRLQLSNTTGETIPTGLSLSYDSKLGIVNYDIDTASLPRDQVLDTTLGTVHIDPPEGAGAYRMYPPFESGLSIRSNIYSLDNDDYQNAEARLESDSPMTGMSGVYGRSIQWPFLDGEEIALIEDHTYKLYANGLPDMGELGGGFRLIYWYESPDDDVPFLKEYILVTGDPASAPNYTTVTSNESDLALQGSAFPRMIVSGTTSGGESYRFYSDVVPQTSDNELHYELRIVDESGEPVSTETLAALAPLTIYIPVPDGVDAYDPALTFTVSHLNADNTRVTETFSYADNSLRMTEFGLCFVVDSLSPFVLSWDPVAPEGLPQTGDDSPALYILLIILLASLVCMAFTMRRKRA